MKSSSYQFIYVVIHVVTSSHYICLISASCAMPDPIPNTITTLPNQTLDTGSNITWECSDGYMMDGLTNTVVWVCLQDGTWLVHTPICNAVKCEGSPPEVANASIIILGSAYQDIALYICQDGYIPDNEPISFCQHTGNWSTPNFTCLEIPKGNSSPNGASTGEIVVSIIFSIPLIVISLIRLALYVSNLGFKLRCCAAKPAGRTPHEPYHPTVEADIDQNGGFGNSVAEQPSPHLDFVDNVLYGTSDEQTVRPLSLNRNSTDQSPGRPKRHPGSGAPETDEDAYEGYEDEEIMVDNELYGASFPTTPRAHKVGPVVVQGDDAVYEITDGNDPVDGEGDGEMYQNTEFHSVPTNSTANELYKSVDEI